MLYLAQKIWKECNQEYIIATYDLQIAKMAIQNENSLKFDDVLII